MMMRFLVGQDAQRFAHLVPSLRRYPWMMNRSNNRVVPLWIEPFDNGSPNPCDLQAGGFIYPRTQPIQSRRVGRVYPLRSQCTGACSLNKVKGPASDQDIRTINGKLYPTYKEACYALGLLDHDNEYVQAIEEASTSSSGHYLRTLFATMLLSNTMSRPESVWSVTWSYLSDGILHNQRILRKNPGS
ncbi:hypothetical protein OSB04_013495 [Centaurea solstitialis]|uniref:Uncharacterized protein n=1 Tax=Centaurea solstitialis TaxID=347529 RepID=A0AA38TP06_9ASTR|nr:hypothetical protein OSB04_013495 [Centaurea solstitialis]